MKLINFIYTLIISLSFLCFAELSVGSLPAKKTNSATSTKVNSSTQADYYQKVRKELGEDWYVVYRVIDRLSRANNLDGYLWRVTLTGEYDIQAYALEESLIAIPRGVLDIAKAGDTSALACVIGHEMAHHTLEHRSKVTANYTQLEEQLTQQVENEIREQARKKKDREDTLNSLRRSASDSKLPKWLRDTNEWMLKINESMPETQYPNPDELRKRAGNELESQYYAIKREQEYEADSEGFMYSVRAGFDQNGCARLFDILARTPQSKVNSETDSHPVVEERKLRIERLAQPEKLESLVQEGKSNVSGKKPLGYELDRNSGWLRINTRFGNAEDDFKRKFPDGN